MSLPATLAAFERAAAGAGGPVWGRCDCLQMALACASRADLAAALPEYRSRAQALRGLRQLGFGRIEDWLDAHGRRVAAALPGDVAMIDQGEVFNPLGVVLGPRAVFIGPDGRLIRLPFSRAWRL